MEFAAARGDTVAVVTLTEEEIRPMGGGEVLHVREVTRRLAG